MKTKIKKKIYSVIAVLVMASVLVTSIPVEAQILLVESNSNSNLTVNGQVYSENVDISKSKNEEEQPGYEINVNCYQHHPDTWKCGGSYHTCYHYKKCDVCKVVFAQESFPSHDYEWITKQPTCLAAGERKHVCKQCEYVESTIPYKDPNPNNHYSSKGKMHKPPTCTERGYDYYLCEYCGKEYNITYVEYPLGHNTYYVTEDPTYTSEGHKWRKCYRSGCGLNELVDTYPKLESENPGSGNTSGEGSGISNGGETSNSSQGNSNVNPWNNTLYILNLVGISSGLPANNISFPKTADPVNTYTGSHEIDHSVISAGGAQNISVGISYKSNKVVPGVFGKGFSWNYESRVEEKDGKVLLYHSPGFYVEYALKAGENYYVTDTQGNEQDKLYKNADGTITLKSNGKTFDYNKDGKLCRLTQKTGEQVTVEYASDNIRLTDGVSGQTITLILNGNGLVSKVTNGIAEAFFEYDDNDYLVKYTDVDGFITAYTYNENGQVLTATDDDGNTYFEDIYDENGRVTEQKDANGNLSYFAYAETENGLKTVFTDRNGNSDTYDFDSAGRLLCHFDKEGNATSYEYDEIGNRTKTVDALGNITLTEYDERSNPVKVTDPEGNVTVYEYDSNDNLVKATLADGNTLTYSYDSKNRLTSSTDLRGLKTVNEYDSYGQLVRTSSGEKTVTYTYENGNVKTVTDALGNVTTFDYDANGHLIETTDALGAVTKQEVSAYGTVLSTTDALNNVTSIVSNCVDKPLTMVDEDGNVVTCKYDSRELLIETTDAKGNITRYEYDKEERPVKTIYSDGTYVTTEYDKKGKAVATVDAKGNRSTVEYDAVGNVLKSTDKEGNVNTYTYTKNGNVATKTDAKGNTTSYEYDCMGRTIKVINPDGGVICYTYNAAGDVTSVTDPFGNVTTYKTNIYGHTTEITDPMGNTTSYEYDLNGNLVMTTDALGNTVVNKYDALNRLVYMGVNDSNPGCLLESYYAETPEAEGTGVLVASDVVIHSHVGTDNQEKQNGCYTTEYQSYEKIGISTRQETWDCCRNCGEGPLAHFAGNPYGACSNYSAMVVTYETDVYGYVTRYTCYHGDEEIIKIKIYKDGNNLYAGLTDTEGNEVPANSYSWEYKGKEAGQSSSLTITESGTYSLTVTVADFYTGEERTCTLSFDAVYEEPKPAEKVNVVSNGPSLITRYEYDLKGQLIAVTDPNGNRSTRQYDKRGHVVKTTDALGNETASSYDVNGNLVSTTNAKGQTTTYEVNALNQVTSKTDALGLVTSFGYDANGNLNKSVNPMGGVSTSIFDKNGNTVALTGPEGAVTAFTYDANGNLASRSTVGGNSVKYTYNASDLVETFENARGQNIRYKYDLCGRVTESASLEGTITYTYDANGNVLTVTDANGTITRTYDALNRVTSITDTKGYVVSYVYDAYGNLSELVYPDNTKVTYTYDLCGNIKTVTDFDGKVTSYTYDALNREVRTDNANFTYVIKEYDAVSNLTKMAEYSSKTGSAISETIYEYDADDRLLTETETVKGYSYIYTYDNLDRVIKRTTLNYATGEVTDEETFSYDGAGNITEALSRNELKAMSYIPEDNRISSLNGSAFTFDDDGNLVSGTINGKNATLTYDSRNHLTAYNADTYVYDSEDYRIESTVQTLVKKDNTTFLITDPVVVTPVKPGKPVTPIPIPVPKPGKGEIMGAADASEEETFEGSCASVPAGTSSIKDTFETDEEEITSEEDAVSEEPSEETEEPLIEEPATEEPSEDVSGNEIPEDDISENDVSSNDIFTEDVSANDTSEGSLSREDLTVAEEVETLPEEEVLPDAEITSSAEDEEVTYTEKTVKTTYCYDRQNKNLLMTVDENGIIEKYVYGNGLISSVETLNITREKTIPKIGTNASTNAVTVTIGSGSGFATLEYKYYTYDIRGSVTRVANSKGTTTTEYSYSTYGNRTSSEELDYSILGYCARDGVLTEANGLLYMRARYYSPDMMRFINEDIVTGDISNSNSLNRYSYVEGNPVTMVDPFGLDAIKAMQNAQELDIFDRISEGFIGLMNAGKGVCMGMEGGAAIGTGIILVLSGPAGWIMGGVMIVGGAYVATCGLADGIEGGHQIVEAVTGTPQDTSNFVRDNVFAWDPDVYYISEALTTCGVSELIRSAQGFLPSSGGITTQIGNDGSSGSSTIVDDAENIGYYLAKKAPYQVSPGTTILEGQYIDDLGRVQPWVAHYDEFGRLIARTDYNAGNITQGIPDTHYHLYEWGPGKTPLEYKRHIAGEYEKP